MQVIGLRDLIALAAQCPSRLFIEANSESLSCVDNNLAPRPAPTSKIFEFISVVLPMNSVNVSSPPLQ